MLRKVTGRDWSFRARDWSVRAVGERRKEEQVSLPVYVPSRSI